jgi:hypothetical protein
MDEWRNLDAFDLVSYEIEISGGDDSRWGSWTAAQSLVHHQPQHWMQLNVHTVGRVALWL